MTSSSGEANYRQKIQLQGESLSKYRVTMHENEDMEPIQEVQLNIFQNTVTLKCENTSIIFKFFDLAGLSLV